MREGQKGSVTPVEHTAIGAVAGIVEVAIMQPTVAIKNALQEGRPLPSNPAAYYRGLIVGPSDLLLD
jgi:solute carrier family 25 citrate transporter 1